jgi:hypothetical protein
MAIKSINPITDVTLENGKTNRLTKKFKYEKKTPDKETKFHPQLVTASIP